MRSGVEASTANMRAYAQRIGAEYRFDKDPNIAGRTCNIPVYYECLNPLLDDAFLKYDRVLSVDADVFAVEGLTQNIFDEPVADMGICTEPHQPIYRQTLKGPICTARDEQWARVMLDRWGIEVPRVNGLVKIYNAGVLLFTREGLLKARARFAPFQKYIDTTRHLGKFYASDQHYIHGMMVKHLEFTELDNEWNRYVHYVGSPDDNPRPIHDSRTKDTKFVHVQLRGADDWSAERLWQVVNG